MEAPRRLYTTEHGEICEADDPRARFLLCAQGMPIGEEEARRVGLLDYLKEYDKAHAKEVKAEAKAVEQAETEDKAIALKEENAVVREAAKEERAAEREAGAEAKASEDEKSTSVHFPPETRRVGGGRRGGE